jgi:hypothetical protein
MCLDKVVQRYNPPKEEEGEGYKVVVVFHEKEISGIFLSFTELRRTPGEERHNGI